MKDLILFFSCFFIVFSSHNGFCEGGTPYKLDDIVVTASRIESPVKEAPANITIITKESIAEQGDKSMSDIMRAEPGVVTTNILGNPKSSSIDIRGYGETAPQNVLFLIDGRRINNADMSGADLSQIPVEMIERIEIFRGPGSVLFGDNATAGVVNIILKKGEGKPKVSARINTGSYNMVAPDASVSGKSGKLSYYLVASSLDTDGYRHNNAFHGKDMTGHFSFKLFKNLSFNAKAGYHKDRYGMPGALTDQQLRASTLDRKDSVTPFDMARTEDNFIDIGANIGSEKDVMLSVNGSYRNRHTSSYWDTFKWNTRRSFQTYAFTPKITVNTEHKKFRNILTGGFDYYKYPSSSNDDTAGLPSTTDIEKRNYGFYINHEISILKKAVFTIGYRVDKAGYDFRSTDWTGFTPPVRDTLNVQKEAFRASVNYLFSKEGNVFLTYAKGFRYPSTDEYFSPLAVPPINTNLRPQDVREIDLGLRWNPIKNAGGGITVFHIKTDDEIFYNPVSFTNENYPKSKRLGVEALISLVFLEDLRFDVNYTYIKATFDGGAFNGNDIPFVPRNKVSAKMIYTYNNWTINLLSVYTGNRYMISDQQNQYRKMPGWTTFDLNAKYRFKSLNAYLGVKNITGTRYNDYGAIWGGTMYFYPAPERQYFFGLQYGFGG